MARYSLGRENEEYSRSLAACQSPDQQEKSIIHLIQEARNAKSRHIAALAAFAFIQVRVVGDDQGRRSFDIQELVHLITTSFLPIKTESDARLQSLIAEAALACLGLLSTQIQDPDYRLDDEDLLAIIAYGDPSDEWTTQEAAHMTAGLVQIHLPDDKLSTFIAESLLQNHFRSIFSKSSTRVTASGRPSYYGQGSEGPQSLIQSSSWKDTQNESVVLSLFRWTVKNSPEELFPTSWPLFTPPLLTLIEDDQTSVRRRGLEIICDFLNKCPHQLLVSTGVRNIMEDAIFPTLMFLPGLTPEDESVKLLRPAYRALLYLSGDASDATKKDTRQALDKLLRDGILAGYFHAAQSPRVVEVLMDYTAVVVKRLGLLSIKHIQSLLSMLSSVILDPFSLTYPRAVVAATKALNATLTNCWPRISTPVHTEHALQTIATCWLRVSEPNPDPRVWKDEMKQLEKELVTAASSLEQIWLQQNNRPPHKMAQIMECEDRLGKLFPLLSGREESRTSGNIRM